jgi:peptidoglycan-associated lipoprotein
MSRKWMAWVLVPAIAVALWGCPKKEPTTPPEPMEMEEAPPPAPPAEEVPSEPEMTQEDRQEPQLPSDVEELNEYLRQNDLVADVFFDFDKSDLRDDARERLQRNARWLKEHPDFQLTVEGHCDERGTNEYNLALGERRANTTKDYLVSLGIAAGRINTISYGEERPVCTESTEACWQENRRAHFVVYPS